MNMSKNMVFELLVSFGIQMVKLLKLKYFTRGIWLYQHCIRETSDIRKTYLPIFLNIFIVTENQMFITSYGN